MGIELRPSQALALWKDVNVKQVQEDALAQRPDLSMRQLAILLTIYLEHPPHTVRGLAAHLKVTKPVITRALDTMGKAGLVSRHRDDNDKRNVVISRTVKGALFVEALGDAIVAKAKELPL